MRNSGYGHKLWWLSFVAALIMTALTKPVSGSGFGLMRRVLNVKSGRCYRRDALRPSHPRTRHTDTRQTKDSYLDFRAGL